MRAYALKFSASSRLVRKSLGRPGLRVAYPVMRLCGVCGRAAFYASAAIAADAWFYQIAKERGMWPNV